MILRHKKTGVTINTKDWEDLELYECTENIQILNEELVASKSEKLIYYVDSDFKIIPSKTFRKNKESNFPTLEQAEVFVIENKKIFSVKDLCVLYLRGRPFGSNKITLTIDLDGLKKSARSMCGLSKFDFNN
jgi:hypothetical protein